MKVVVGLGNPGREYAATRHNVGFMVVGRLAKELHADAPRKRFRSELVEANLGGEKVVLVAPQTFMNLSGHAVREVVQWFHLPVEELLVVADDLDLPFGTLRLRARGSAGGHNGLESIIEQLGTREFSRLKVGIGRGRGNAESRVLSRFAPEEEAELPALIEQSTRAIRIWIGEGILAAMNAVNRRAGAQEQAADDATVGVTRPGG